MAGAVARASGGDSPSLPPSSTGGCSRVLLVAHSTQRQPVRIPPCLLVLRSLLGSDELKVTPDAWGCRLARWQELLHLGYSFPSLAWTVAGFCLSSPAGDGSRLLVQGSCV